MLDSLIFFKQFFLVPQQAVAVVLGFSFVCFLLCFSSQKSIASGKTSKHRHCASSCIPGA